MNNTFDVFVTDLDHTLLHPETERISEGTPNLLNEWMDRGNHWVIATGRELDHLQEVLSEVGIQPHYCITRSRYIHASRSEPSPELDEWNETVNELTEKQAEYTSEWIPKARNWASRKDIHVEVEDGYITYESAEAAEKAFHHLSEIVDEDFKVLRNREFMIVVPRQTGKGNCLKRLSEVNRWRESDIFCVGDGMNDANMLDGDYDYGKAVVANAEDPLKNLVTREGGRVLDQVGGTAVEKLLKTFLNRDNELVSAKKNGGPDKS